MILKEIDMNSDTFDAIKTGMTLHIKDLLRQMDKYGTSEGSVSVKIDVTLMPCKDGDMIPFFKFKVASAVQIKDESKGTMGGNCTLVRADDGHHQLAFGNDQVSMFDE